MAVSRTPSAAIEQTLIKKLYAEIKFRDQVRIERYRTHAQASRALKSHVDYVGRYGNLEIEVDDGSSLQGRAAGEMLLADWDLDLDEHRRHSHLAAAYGRPPPRLVHKLMFSMPPGTPAAKLLAAVRNFAREQFALQHRYAMVLHTDEPHPHVHMLLKAVSEQGARLNIRKATLREWRAEFARHLRDQGIAANATERAVRGESRSPKKDGIYRATRRGDSSHMQDRVAAVICELANGELHLEPGESSLARTRADVTNGWRALTSRLIGEGRHELAGVVQRFVERMPPASTEKQWLAARLGERLRAGNLRIR